MCFLAKLMMRLPRETKKNPTKANSTKLKIACDGKINVKTMPM